MVNIAVLNLKGASKYICGICIMFTIILGVKNYLNTIDVNMMIDSKSEELSSYTFLELVDTTIPIVTKEEEEKYISSTSKSIAKTLIESEFIMPDIVSTSSIEVVEVAETVDTQEKEDNEIVQKAEDDVKTEIIDKSGINTKYTNTYKTVQIKNESKYELTEEMLNPSGLSVEKKDILIFHTHTCESYTPSEKYQYEASGTYRTTNLERSVVRVGTELKNQLLEYGYKVTHDTTYHDYPAYSGSYNRSLKTVQAALETCKNTEIVFDIHRDAVGSSANYAPTVKIGEEYAAQLMFVIGTDGGGLKHPNWNQNLKFAIMIQEKANELYPGLFKPIILRNSRYNQHVTNKASIIEVGATGNTLDQCLVSMKYLAKVIDEVINK